MRTGGVNPRAAAIMVTFALSCFGLLLFLWLSFGGAVPLLPEGYRVNASFAEATTLAVEADVRISGVPVGKVKRIEPDRESGRSDVVLEIEERFAPLPRDVRAILRQKTLLGETYVELTPGSEEAPSIPEGGRIPASAISEAVQLDEIFRAFDPRTRAALRTWMQQQARAIGGHGRDLNDALGNLGPFAEDAGEIVAILERQREAVQGLVSNGATVFEALSERDARLRSMVSDLNAVFRTTARRDRRLQEAFVALPTFQRETRATLRRLDRFAANADPLVTRLRPAARELSPALEDLEALSPDLKALFRDIDPLITASRTGFPAAEQLLDDLEPLLEQVHPAMQQVIPILQFIRPYERELTAFLANTVAATQARDPIPGTDRRVHYLRTTNPLNPELLAAYPRRIGSNRPNPYMHPGAFTELEKALPAFDDRHCGRGIPVVSQITDPVLELVIPQTLRERISEFILPLTSHGQIPAPPCRRQRPFEFQGETSRYPHVKPAR